MGVVGVDVGHSLELVGLAMRQAKLELGLGDLPLYIVACSLVLGLEFGLVGADVGLP